MIGVGRGYKMGGWVVKFYLRKGEAQKVLDLRFSHFVAPFPVINDHSLMLVYDLCKQTGDVHSITTPVVDYVNIPQ